MTRCTACLVVASIASIGMHAVSQDGAPPAAAPKVRAQQAPAPTAGFTSLFDGRTLAGWGGDTEGYVVEDGAIKCTPAGRNLHTLGEYGDCHLKLQFKLAAGSNNGIGIRAPKDGDAAFEGMEIQVLDDTAEKWKDLKEWQFCCSVYGVVPARRGHLKPVGEWNEEEIIAKGSRITVKLNGHVVVDADVAEASRGGTPDGRDHPGLKRTSGHIHFCGHGDPVWFRAIEIKELK